MDSKKIFAEGKEYGFSEMELYTEESRSLSLRVFNQEIDHYGIEESQGTSFRGLLDGKMGYAYSEKLEEESISALVKGAGENARVISGESSEIFAGSNEYQQIKPYSQKLAGVSSNEKIDLLVELEKRAFAEDERVSAVNYCLYSDITTNQEIINSLGLHLSYANNLAYLYLSIVAKEGEDVRTGSHFIVTQDFSKFDPGLMAKRAVEEAVSLFSARSLPSGDYPVILRYDVAADLLATFASTLSAENVQKGLSLFQGKLGQQVAANKVTIIDDPFMPGGARTAPFDAEGVATSRKNVIEKGKLTTYLHNLKTAKKDGLSSTGNAYRGSYKGFIDIAPANMYLQAGEKDYADLIKSIEKGIIVISVQGLHSGANPVSGDFSLGAYGYYVENGEIQRPVDQITIAGNFLEVLQNIEVVGNDFAMSLPGAGHFGSPSIKIKGLSIAGE